MMMIIDKGDRYEAFSFDNVEKVKLPIDDYLELLEFKKKTLEGAVRVESYHGAVLYFSEGEAIKNLIAELGDVTVKIDENTKFIRSEIEPTLYRMARAKSWATGILDRIKGEK